MQSTSHSCTELNKTHFSPVSIVKRKEKYLYVPKSNNITNNSKERNFGK